MNNKDYQTWAKTLDRDDEGYSELVKDGKPNMTRLVHMALGAGGETGEVQDLIKKSFAYKKELDLTKLKFEIGDALWYFANMLTAIDSSFDEVMQMNYDKLTKRYSSGSFSEKEAVERADTK